MSMQGSVQQRLTAVLVLLGMLSIGCENHPEVVIRTQAGDMVRVPVELAVTPETRTRGLMYRRNLPSDAGMLFVFPETSQYSFWMKNTPLALDMIFIDEQLRVVGLVENAVPFSLAPLSVGKPSRYVLEVHAGFGKRHHVQAGDQVEFRNVPGS